MSANEDPDQMPPAEFVIPKRIVVSRRSFEKLLARMKEKAPPPPALVALMRGVSTGHPRD